MSGVPEHDRQQLALGRAIVEDEDHAHCPPLTESTCSNALCVLANACWPRRSPPIAVPGTSSARSPEWVTDAWVKDLRGCRPFASVSASEL